MFIILSVLVKLKASADISEGNPANNSSKYDPEKDFPHANDDALKCIMRCLVYEQKPIQQTKENDPSQDIDLFKKQIELFYELVEYFKIFSENYEDKACRLSRLTEHYKIVKNKRKEMWTTFEKNQKKPVNVTSDENSLAVMTLITCFTEIRNNILEIFGEHDLNNLRYTIHLISAVYTHCRKKYDDAFKLENILIPDDIMEKILAIESFMSKKKESQVKEVSIMDFLNQAEEEFRVREENKLKMG